MGKIFNMDSPIMRFLGRVWDVMVVNFLNVVFLVPMLVVIYFGEEIASVSFVLFVILLFLSALFIGPALTGSHYICLKMVRNEDSYLVRGFFHSVRDNFRQAMLMWAFYLVFFLILAFDVYAFLTNGTSAFPSWMNIAVIVVAILLWMNFLWAFPILAHFSNTVPGTIKNAIIMSMAGFPRTLGMAGISAIPFLVIYTGSSYSVPILIMFGIGAPIYFCAYLYSKFFEKFEPKPEKEKDPDAMPQGLLGDVDNPEFIEAVEELRKDYEKISYDVKEPEEGEK